MYAEPGLIMFPMLQSFPHQLPHGTDMEELLCHYPTHQLPYGATSMGNPMQASTILEYDLGGEGDLFKAPEPIVDESLLAFDPVSAAMSFVSTGQDIITETIKAADIESIQNERLNDVLYDCKRDLLAKYATSEPFPELPDVEVPGIGTEEVPSLEKIRLSAEGQMQKSVSSGCLDSMEWIGNCSVRPNFLDFRSLDFETAFGLRRAYSEGDIQGWLQSVSNADLSGCEQSLKNGSIQNLANASSIPTSFERQLTISQLKTEERKQKLSRYRKKKTKRNFERKIKYACRKALADSQPRVRGRFAKTEDCEIPKLPQRTRTSIT